MSKWNWNNALPFTLLGEQITVKQMIGVAVAALLFWPVFDGLFMGVSILVGV